MSKYHIEATVNETRSKTVFSICLADGKSVYDSFYRVDVEVYLADGEWRISDDSFFGNTSRPYEEQCNKAVAILTNSIKELDAREAKIDSVLDGMGIPVRRPPPVVLSEPEPEVLLEDNERRIRKYDPSLVSEGVNE